ncbi:MAG: DUF3043 domain-containing protein [Arcanobacterium sp.]|nr:DUF3043 domain-containing protein [Arcanobacterium sp.]
MVFGLKKKQPESAENAVEATPPLPKGYTPKKGTPTPKRKDAQAANMRPVIADHSKMTKEQKKAARAENRRLQDELYHKQQVAMRTGDERNMPYQHRGKVRRFARNYVDAAAPVSAFFMPLAILLIPVFLLQARWPQIAMYVTYGFYLIFITMLIHAIIVVRRAKLLTAYHYGEDEVPRGFTWQMIGRAFYLRRWRLPAPQVKRGEFPEGSTLADLKAARKAHKAAKKAK